MDHSPELSVTHASLAERLAVCAAKIGGKRALAAAAGISEAQLFRYISGDSEMPAARVIAVATASGVKPGWLLTGTDTGDTAAQPVKSPEFRPELLAAISQTLDEVLADHPRAIPPSRKGKLLSFMYQALRHEETIRNAPVQVSKPQILLHLDFLSGPRGDDTLETLGSVMQRLEYGPLENRQLMDMEANLFCRTIEHGFTQLYNGISGSIYFERMTDHVSPAGIKRLSAMMERLRRDDPTRKLSLLDIGCGNGRELSFLYRHHTNIELHGLELSDLGLSLCESAMRAKRLPANSVVKGSFTSLPFDDASMDAIYSHMTLYCLPYLAEHPDCGANQAFAEVSRVLKPGGTFEFVTLYGNGREYLSFAQLHNADTLEMLAKQHGLELISLAVPDGVSANQNLVNQHMQAASKYDYSLTAVLRKPI